MPPPLVHPGSRSPRPARRAGLPAPRRFRPRLVRLESRVLLAGAPPAQITTTPAPTSLGLVAPTTATYGQPIPVTATLTAPGGSTLSLPSQGFKLIIDGQPVTPDSIEDGTVTAVLRGLAAGSYPIEASFAGDAHFAASEAVPVTLVVARAATRVVLDPVPAIGYGQPATLQATIADTAGAATPTGSVRFVIGGPQSADQTVQVRLVDGVATLPLSRPAAGDYSITAEYLGDANFLPSGLSAPAPPLAVTQAPTTTQVSFDSTAPIDFGEDRPIEVTVTPTNEALGTPTGTVELVGQNITIPGTLDASGQVRFSTATLQPGPHSITVEYQGSGDFAASQAPAALSFTVAPATIALDPIAPDPTYGQPVTLQATVTNHSTAGDLGGSVTFFVDGEPPPRDAPVGTTLNLGVLPAGSYTVVAEFAADGADFGPSVSPPLTFSIAKAAASFTLAPPVDTPSGQLLTLTASVTSDLGTPTGEVEFLVDDGDRYEGTLVAGKVTVSVPGLAVGSHQVTARYEGDGNFLAGDPTAPASVAITTSTRTSVTLDPVAASVFGQAISLVARVTSGVGSSSAGEVEFLVDGLVQGTGSVVAGSASVTVPGLTAGVHSVVARYVAADGAMTAASPAGSAAVRPARTTTHLAASQTRLAASQTLALTATVAPEAAAADEAIGGSVTFDVDGTPVATVELAEGGVATLPALTLAAGDHQVTAIYNGLPGRFAASAASTGSAPTISLLGGTGVAGLAGDGGPAAAAECDAPSGLAVGAQGQLLIVDSAGNRVRMISNPAGSDPIITSVAGAGRVGAFASALATLNDPTAIATDAVGDVFVADTGNGRILVLNPTTGQIAVLLGAGAASAAARVPLDRPQGLAVDPAGTTLYVADTGNNRIIRVDLSQATGLPTAGPVAPLAATIVRLGVANDVRIPGLAAPTGLALDPSGNLIIADTGNNLVRRFAPATDTLTIVGGNPGKAPRAGRGEAIGTTLAGPAAVAVLGSGQIDVLCAGDNTIHSIGTDGGTATVADLPSGGTAVGGAQGLAAGADGTLIVANTAKNILETVSFAEPDLEGSASGVEVDVASAGGGFAVAGLQVSAQLVPLAGASVALVGTIVVSVASAVGSEADVTAVGAPNQTVATTTGQTLLDEAGGGDAAGDPGAEAPDDGAPDQGAPARPIDTGVLDGLLDSSEAAEEAYRRAFARPEPAPAPRPDDSPDLLLPSRTGSRAVDPIAADLILASLDWPAWRPAALGGIVPPDALGFPAVAVLAASALAADQSPRSGRRAWPRAWTR